MSLVGRPWAVFSTCLPSAFPSGLLGDSQVCPRLWRNGRRFHRHSPRLSQRGSWQPHLPCSVMATTSPVSLSTCLIKAKPVVAESPIAAEAAPDVATLPYHKSISHAYCCEFSVPCHCSQRTFAPDSAHRHQQRIIYAPKTIFAISSIWDTWLVPGVRLTTFVLLSVGKRYGQ